MRGLGAYRPYLRAHEGAGLEQLAEDGRVLGCNGKGGEKQEESAERREMSVLAYGAMCMVSRMLIVWPGRLARYSPGT